MPKDTKEKDKKAFALIRNKIIHSGEGPTLKDINVVTGGRSPRSASIIIDRLIKAGLVKKINGKIKLSNSALESKESAPTIQVPLIGSVACGTPMLARQNIETYIPISINSAKKGFNYFLLRAKGNSMNKAGIQNGSIILVRQQPSADNGDKVVALIDNDATVKILEKTEDAIILRPKSTDTKHKPIVITGDCEIQGVVVATLPKNLYKK